MLIWQEKELALISATDDSGLQMMPFAPSLGTARSKAGWCDQQIRGTGREEDATEQLRLGSGLSEILHHPESGCDQRAPSCAHSMKIPISRL